MDTAGASPDRMFVFPQSGKACSRSQIMKILMDIIKSGDPASSPQSRDLRSFASSLAYLRLFQVDQLREQDRWESAQSFCNSYACVQRYMMLSEFILFIEFRRSPHCLLSRLCF